MQLPFYLLVIAITVLSIWYLYLHHSLIPSTEKHLQKIAYATENAIQSYLKTIEKNARFFAEQQQTKNFMTTLTSLDSEIKQQEKNYDAFIISQQETLYFKDILLINLDKKILYATTTKDIVGQPLTNSADSHGFLSQSFDRSIMSLTADFSEYGHDPLFKNPTLFITVPIIIDNKIKGVLAYECDVQKIASFTQNYTGLGETGEIVLAQQSGSFILFVAPSRHDNDLAFKRIKLFSKNPPAIQQSVLGKQGIGTALDYRTVPVVAAWTFITKINWGMIVKIDQAEVLHPLYFIIKLLLLCFVFLIVWAIFIERIYHEHISQHFVWFNNLSVIKKIPPTIKNCFFFLFLISCALLLKTACSFYYHSKAIVNEETLNIIKDIKNGAAEIDTILKKITFISQSIADDLRFNRLSKDDIAKRIKRDLTENNAILGITIAFAPYKYDPEKKLYAPTVNKTNNIYQETMLEDLYDYTLTDSQHSTSWYHKAIQLGSVWLSPEKHGTEKHSLEKIIPAAYAMAFFDSNKELQGVIYITYNFSEIERIAAYSSLARKGYSILLSEHNTFLYHPVHSFIFSEKTLIDYAQEIASQSLIDIAHKISQHASLLSTYYVPSDSQPMWIYAQPLTTNNWTLAAIFSKEDISMPVSSIRHNFFLILLYAILSLCFLCAYAFSFKKISLLSCVIMINLFFSIGLIALWRIIQKTPSAQTTDSTVITDQASLDKFLDDLFEESTRKQEEPPIQIPCGLLLYSLDMPKPDEMIVSGYLWTKYDIEKHKNITHKIQLPHAIKLILDTPATSIQQNWETVTWNIRGTIYEKQHYGHFPFDKQQMQITIEHHDIEKNIILTPDLEDYKKISPEETPGLDKHFTLSEFNIERAFFNYKRIEPVTNYGFTQYGKTTDHYQLIYNLIITRGLLSPFILYFLPLLVILFSLFSVLVIAKRTTEPLSIITPYTGLFFALVLLHRSLREQYSTGTTLYIEYAFFFAYVTIILLVIHTVLVYLYPHWNYYQHKIFPLAKLIFWPLQLVAWLITTFIIFY